MTRDSPGHEDAARRLAKGEFPRWEGEGSAWALRGGDCMGGALRETHAVQLLRMCELIHI